MRFPIGWRFPNTTCPSICGSCETLGCSKSRRRGSCACMVCPATSRPAWPRTTTFSTLAAARSASTNFPGNRRDWRLQCRLTYAHSGILSTNHACAPFFGRIVPRLLQRRERQLQRRRQPVGLAHLLVQDRHLVGHAHHLRRQRGGHFPCAIVAQTILREGTGA